tara:strand:+ start:753 stop:977 length:225 start_codon:yes stop_codon:yes gene_type:complete
MSELSQETQIALINKDIETIKNNHLFHIEKDIKEIKEQIAEDRIQSREEHLWLRNLLVGGLLMVFVAQVMLKFV